VGAGAYLGRPPSRCRCPSASPPPSSLLALGCAAPVPLPATSPLPGPDPALQETLLGLVEGFEGEVGVYVRHLQHGGHS
jgi:hypothetical protein